MVNDVAAEGKDAWLVRVKPHYNLSSSMVWSLPCESMTHVMLSVAIPEVSLLIINTDCHVGASVLILGCSDSSCSQDSGDNGYDDYVYERYFRVYENDDGSYGYAFENGADEVFLKKPFF